MVPNAALPKRAAPEYSWTQYWIVSPTVPAILMVVTPDAEDVVPYIRRAPLRLVATGLYVDPPALPLSVTPVTALPK